MGRCPGLTLGSRDDPGVHLGPARGCGAQRAEAQGQQSRGPARPGHGYSGNGPGAAAARGRSRIAPRTKGAARRWQPMARGGRAWAPTEDGKKPPGRSPRHLSAGSRPLQLSPGLLGSFWGGFGVLHLPPCEGKVRGWALCHPPGAGKSSAGLGLARNFPRGLRRGNRGRDEGEEDGNRAKKRDRER